MKRRFEQDEDSSEDESRFQEAAITTDTLLESSKLNQKSFTKSKTLNFSSNQNLMESWIFTLKSRLIH